MLSNQWKHIFTSVTGLSISFINHADGEQQNINITSVFSSSLHVSPQVSVLLDFFQTIC